MNASSTLVTAIKKVNAHGTTETDDVLAVEEPLEIRVRYGPADARTEKNLSVTMRTPGHDEDLATGFFLTEGIIRESGDITAIHAVPFSNIVIVELRDDLGFDMKKLERHFYTTSSCGVCGKSSLDAVRTSTIFPSVPALLPVDASIIHALPDLLRSHQELFETTGGLHASALFDTTGKLLLLREDVGRHNALDKLIGSALRQQMLPLSEHILLLSGRASFELIQKAAMAGNQRIATVGAPSSLAVELARECRMTLIGFLRNERFNIYSGELSVDGSGDNGKMKPEKINNL